MKFKLVENLIDELDLISDSLIDELKNKFGNDFDSKPLCREVTKYIEDKLINPVSWKFNTTLLLFFG